MDDSDETDIANDSDTDEDDAPKSTNESRKTNETNLIEIRESFINWKDNLVFFINQQGCLCDNGARILKKNDEFKLKDTIIGQARLRKSSNGYLIALTITNNVSLLTQLETLKETLRSLFDVTMELGLKTVFILRDNVNSIP